MECKARNLSIHYEVRGEGKPIIILHGYTVDHRLMLGCMEPLLKDRKDYRRIYPDLPGMGNSKADSSIVNSDQMLDIIIEFIEKIIPGENFLLAGESYGGYLARGIIGRLKSRVDGLFLLCPSIEAVFDKRNVPEHVILEKNELLMSELEPSDAAGFASINVVLSRKVWERYRDEILVGIKIADHPFLEYIWKNGYSFSFDVDQLCGRFDKPALLLLGRQDSSVGYRDAWCILDNYPRATFAVLDKAGHNLQIEQPELFNPLVKEWLERVSSNG